MSRILLVEDEESVAELIKRGLVEDLYEVIHAKDGLSGLEILEKEDIELVILDILLPKMNGLEVCRKIRSLGHRDLPILMLTALNTPENVVLGLDNGADDYLGKPFKLIELKARIRTLLRRAETNSAQGQRESEVYYFDDIELNNTTKQVRRNGQEISLTSTEFRLLLMFMKYPDKVLTRTVLLDDIWGIDFDIGTNVVDVYVNYLRKKLDTQSNKKVIHTVVGMGYVLRVIE